MISFQHACLPSVLAYATATALPPSPVDSPQRCDSPFTPAVGTDSTKHALSSPTRSIGSQEHDTTPRQPTREPKPADTLDSGADSISNHDVEPENVPLPTTPRETVPDKHDTDKQQQPQQQQQRQEQQQRVPSIADPVISVAQFAHQRQLQKHQEIQKYNTLLRLRDLHVSVHLSTRLLRVAVTSQKGLVESFKYGDKSGFASIYNAIHDIHETCNSTTRRHILDHDPLVGSINSSIKGKLSNFAEHLSPNSRADLLEILTLVRTDSQFLFQCISNLTPSQLSAFVSPVHSLELCASGSPHDSRGRNHPSFFKRNTSHSPAFKEHAFSFERTDPLSTLIFNVYATTLGSEAVENRLRLDVWSSTCAKLVSYGGSGQYTFVGHLLNIWSGFGEWKLKPKLEIYLMDVLQKGAFFLEHSNNRGPGMEDLRTDLAEQFFRTSVQALFAVLDDSDGGFPPGALEFGKSVVEKLGFTETRRRFLGYIFYQWFFCKFLHNAICFPEMHGMLLDFHITKDARERLLSQIALHAETQVSQVLHSPPHFSYANPDIRVHVESMLSHITRPAKVDDTLKQTSSLADDDNSISSALLLSATDIVTILDTFFPKNSALNSSTGFSQNPSMPSSPTSTLFSRSSQPNQPFESGLFQGRIDTLAPSSSTAAKTVFTTEMSFQDATRSYFVNPNNPAPQAPLQHPLTRGADRIRYEIMEIRVSEDRPSMDHPANEDWATFAVREGGGVSFDIFEQDESEQLEQAFADQHPGKLMPSHDKIEDAIFKLVQECGSFDLPTLANDKEALNLRQIFVNAMASCQRKSDFLGAHYWWEVATILRGAYSTYGASTADMGYLAPMFFATKDSVEKASNIIQYCERSFVELKRVTGQLQSQISKIMGTLSGLRTKMWYMTDVKNSLRYEDAKNVAMALKTMSSVQVSPPPSETGRFRSSRSLGGSFLQKPEIQLMNVMRAAKSQGGPFKLADEQVDITRKWLQRSGIDNFCRGEERIHRFCYEVKTSVGKLVGETMSDTPVLWSSELYQRERSIYETSATRPLTGSLRSSVASEDSLGQQFGMRSLDQLFRPPTEPPLPSLIRKSSYQSFASDKLRSRDFSSGDTSSIGDSPGKAGSITTVDSVQPFWSPMHTHAQSTTSASSLRSRPPSMFSDMATSRRVDHNAQKKAAFLDELRRASTSLFLSDLGSPVWSCGSETDAWFSDYLNQDRVQSQMESRARMDRFLSECSTRPAGYLDEDLFTALVGGRLRRCRSAPALRRDQNELSTAPNGKKAEEEEEEEEEFAYHQAFGYLMEQFSRPANPCTKLRALHNIWTLTVASLKSANSARKNEQANSSILPRTRSYSGKYRRDSTSTLADWDVLTESRTPTPSSPNLSGTFAVNNSPTEKQITTALRDLIQKYQPKTLFRDLQFIAAFVPSDILNKSESGTAFLQFGLAALELRDDVCNSMVEIADTILRQELTQRRHTPCSTGGFSSDLRNGIMDAVNMWIITAREGNAVAQRELAILYLTHPHLVRPVTLPLTRPSDTFKTEPMYRQDRDSKSDEQNMRLALHWMQLSAAGGDELAKNRLREREEFDSIA